MAKSVSSHRVLTNITLPRQLLGRLETVLAPALFTSDLWDGTFQFWSSRDFSLHSTTVSDGIQIRVVHDPSYLLRSFQPNWLRDIEELPWWSKESRINSMRAGKTDFECFWKISFILKKSFMYRNCPQPLGIWFSIPLTGACQIISAVTCHVWETMSFDTLCVKYTFKRMQHFSGR